MDSVRDFFHSCIAGIAAQPTKRQLLKLDSKLICQIERPASTCGLHVSYLVTAFEAVSHDWTTQDVLQQLVHPQTSHWRCRYVDIIDSTYVGTATYFVSHNLQAPFHQLVHALRRRFYFPNGQERPEAADAFLWIDAFAINHHVIGYKQEYHQLFDVLACCRSTLVVLDGKCRALSRLLVLYEVWATLQVAKENKSDEPQLEVLPSCVDPRYLRNELLHLDVRNASLLRDCDKDWLLDQLMSRGVTRVNQMVRTAMAHSAQKMARSIWQDAQESIDPDNDDPASAVHDLHVCAMIIQLTGHYTQALDVYKHAIRMWESDRGKLKSESPLTLLMHTTELLLLLKQWDEARAMAEEALQLSMSDQMASNAGKVRSRPTSMSGAHFSSEVYGVDRGGNAAAAKVPEPLELTVPSSLPCTILLARALMGQGQADRAESMVREVCVTTHQRADKLKRPLAVRRDKGSRTKRLVTGAESARAMMALADILRLRDTGVSEAIKLYLRAQRGLAKAMGEKHPEVAYVQMRIGQLLRNQNKLDQAQQILQSVLAVYERSWGEHHPETASAMVYLADVELGMLRQKDYEFTDTDLHSALHKAMRQYMQAFEIRKTCLGLNHVDTLATLTGAIVQLINSSTTRVQLAKAEPMCGLAVKCSMAMQQANSSFRLADAAAQELLRKQAANVVSCLDIMGMVLSTAGKAKDAIHVYEQGHLMAEEELPANHQLAAHCLLGLADLQQVQHDWVLAEATYRQALAIYMTLIEAAAVIPPPVVHAPPPRGLGRISVGLARGLRRISLSSDPRSHATVHAAVETPTSRALDHSSVPFLRTQASAATDQQGGASVPLPEYFSSFSAGVGGGPTGPGSPMAGASRHHRVPSKGAPALPGASPRASHDRSSTTSAPGGGGWPSGRADNFAALSVVQESVASEIFARESSARALSAFQQPNSPSRRRSASQTLPTIAQRPPSNKRRNSLDVSAAGIELSSIDDPPSPSRIMLPHANSAVARRSASITRSSAPIVPGTDHFEPPVSPSGGSLTGERRLSITKAWSGTGAAPERDLSTLSFTSRRFQEAMTGTATGTDQQQQALPAAPPPSRQQVLSRFYKPPLETETSRGRDGLSAPMDVEPQGSADMAVFESIRSSGPGVGPMRAMSAHPNTSGQLYTMASDQQLAHAETMPTPVLNNSGPLDGRASMDGRGSTLGRLAKLATARLTATLTAPMRDLASMTTAAASVAASAAAAAEKQQAVADRIVQVPKLGEVRVSPHQLILNLRGKMGNKQLALIQQEAAVVANNLALLLRWSMNLGEADIQMRSALLWSTPAAPPVLQRTISKSESNAGPMSLRRSSRPGLAAQSVRMNLAAQSVVVGDIPTLLEGPSANPSVHAPVVNVPEMRLERLSAVDAHLQHARGLMMSNQAGLFIAQSRYREAEELYLQGVNLCMQATRSTDAMIIGLNLLQLYGMQGMEQQALDVACKVVSPHLRVTFGPDAGRRHGFRQQQVMRQAVEDAGVGTGAAPATATLPMFDLQLQIIEALSERMVDDGGQVLYEWAAEAMAHYEASKQRAPDRARLPQLPETVFLLQVPGIHLKCVHMVRWLLVLDASKSSSWRNQHFSTHICFSNRVSQSGHKGGSTTNLDSLQQSSAVSSQFGQGGASSAGQPSTMQAAMTWAGGSSTGHGSGTGGTAVFGSTINSNIWTTSSIFKSSAPQASSRGAGGSEASGLGRRGVSPTMSSELVSTERLSRERAS